jgi:serine/threonine protein kinase
MNHFLKSDLYNKRNLFRNINYQLEIQKNNFRQIKEYYKSKSNLYNFLKNKNCSQFLENFELIDYINSGASGVVYKGCSNKNRNNTVCLKFLLNKLEVESRDTKLNNNNEKEAKLGEKRDNNNNNNNNKNVLPKIEEIKIQQKLQHKNIAKYYDYCDLKEYGCIVMELADYGDLDYFKKKYIPRNYCPEAFLCYIAKQILDGLFYIHKLKIIHMDIKQQNILLDKNLDAKITDFSISLSYENIKDTDKIKLPLAGTSLYMSPEVLAKEHIDVEDASKIDMFSLGVMLYNLAFGDFPYKLNLSLKKNFSEILYRIKNNKLEIPEDKIKSGKYSYLFIRFLKNILEKNIKNRMSVFDSLDDPWIKGTDLIIREKEKIDDTTKFYTYITTDNFRTFNEYLKMNNSETINSSN